MRAGPPNFVTDTVLASNRPTGLAACRFSDRYGAYSSNPNIFAMNTAICPLVFGLFGQ